MKINRSTKYLSILCFALVFTIGTYAQTNNTSSPYSLFGLGVETNSNVGRNSAMGRTGIALDGFDQLNLYNPASFASIQRQRFVFDFGVFTEFQNISSNDGDETRANSNFSNIAIGFNGNGKYGVGLSLKPATSVGYELIGVQSNIEGSTGQFSTNILGSGGVNDVSLDYGRKIFVYLNLGVKLSYLFGNIEESETIVVQNSVLSIIEDNYYEGFQIGFGLQYKLAKKYNFGFTLDLPADLIATRDRVVERIANDGSFSLLEETTDQSLDNFSLPLRVGFGFSTKYKNVLFSADYTSSFWSDTDQSEGVSNYVDQNVFALGAEYIKNPVSLKYWERINFRAGLNYNSGFLEVDDKKIDSYSLSLGMGLPVGRRLGSYLNLSYNVGKRGTTESFLVQDNFSTINLNLTLSGIWFQKRKYN
ncbi:MAG: outer membrane protein transport protein [Winogradskyella sp.]